MVMDSHDNTNQVADIVYKTKIVQFLGRTVPIILQNDNGPCPLLAICNVLLLRNHLKLSPETPEVASSRLLSLVAERLLDSNSNLESKDEEYARNLQQNISDAITLLPNLATGLHVNVCFRSIHDFEFTRECTVFDLLDIGLVHGWIFDPQDEVTSKAIGANSYNTLVEKLVELQTTKPDSAFNAEDDVDFAAATTAALGVPSPSREVLLKTKSVEESDLSKLTEAIHIRKGDEEEAAQILEALKCTMDKNVQADQQLQLIIEPSQELSAGSIQSKVSSDPVESSSFESGKKSDIQVSSDPVESSSLESGKKSEVQVSSDPVESSSFENGKKSEIQVSSDPVESTSFQNGKTSEDLKDKELCDSFVQINSEIEQSNKGVDDNHHNEINNGSTMDALVPNYEQLTVCAVKGEAEFLEIQTSTSQVPLCNVLDTMEGQDNLKQKSVVESERLDSMFNADDAACLSLRSSEPLYEGEAEVGTSHIGDREPLYEGEANLVNCPEQIGFHGEGAVIDNFLKTHASQLTYYGLFCLQEGLKERELCVFFRNNHFNTMFKYNGQLYLLVTDQGYINQPDIVWEKLDEVHGDTVFVTGMFEPFLGEESNGSWDEQGVIRATTDFISKQQKSNPGATDTGFDRDLQLAMSLQQQEFEQQQQQQQPPQQLPRPVRPHSQTAVPNRLITGPMNGSYSPKPADQKSKCVIM